ncbi:MAG: cytochrome c oxidase subunit II [Gammaproteobacteria bacterium]|nr:cytochrome c oxidase subunit II [Gammaproteobacteria bacterium]
MTLSAIKKVGALVSGLVLSGIASSAFAIQPWNMPEGVTEVSHIIYDLHSLIFWICVAIAVGVFAVMFYSIFAHRKSKGHKAAQFHESTLVEVIWTTIPFVILIFIAIPATKALIKIDDVGNADMTLKITGYQWKWQYDYLEDGISYYSNLKTPRAQIYGQEEKGENYLLEVDNEVVLPINKKIRFLITASDVIHAWWVPELAVKQDAIPGFVNEAWTRIDKPGVYRGQCAELCGRDHGFMPIVVRAVEQEEYDKWMAKKKQVAQAEAASVDQQWNKDDLMTKGEEIYNKTCASCHQASGEGLAGMFPAIKGSEVAKGDAHEHLNVVINGRSGTSMAAFGPQLNDVQLASVVTYQRNAWGNDTGDIIQPNTIKALR